MLIDLLTVILDSVNIFPVRGRCHIVVPFFTLSEKGMDDMREKLQKFMIGRYGADELGRAINIGVLICFVISLFSALLPVFSVFYWIGILLFIVQIYRMFSRNTAKRYQENQKFRDLRYRASIKKNGFQTRWAQRGIYRFYKCPSCRQRVRVPKGHGRICITCPKCKTEFVKKS